MKRTIFIILASAAMLSGVGASAGEVGSSALRQASKAAARATEALRVNRFDKAIEQAERAVLFNPESAAHRALLGQSYLRAGRFLSAETAFRDALRLDATQGPAALGLALSQIALGRSEQARDVLTAADTLIQPADRGLAFALAGDAEQAVVLLEPVARSDSATPKVRQNLAFSYALAGRWNEARATAALDLDPALVDARLVEWAGLVRPRGTADQVAAILGVKPAPDAGMPERLALLEAQPAEAVRFAEVPAPAPQIAEPVEQQPYLMMAAAAAPISGPDPAPMAMPVSMPAPLLVAASEVMTAPPAPARVEAGKPLADPADRSQRPRGNWVVQLGAFSSAERLDFAWSGMMRRASFIDAHPAIATSTRGRSGQTYYRLSLAGFDSRAAADDICGRIRASGGDCFVRADSGETPLRWAKRSTPQQIAAR